MTRTDAVGDALGGSSKFKQSELKKILNGEESGIKWTLNTAKCIIYPDSGGEPYLFKKEYCYNADKGKVPGRAVYWWDGSYSSVTGYRNLNGVDCIRVQVRTPLEKTSVGWVWITKNMWIDMSESGGSVSFSGGVKQQSVYNKGGSAGLKKKEQELGDVNADGEYSFGGTTSDEVGSSVNGEDGDSSNERGEVGLDESGYNPYEEITENSNPWAEETKFYTDIETDARKNYVYSARSFNSVVGLPVQFMGNVDMRIGQSSYGQRYTEDILYDAPLCTILPGVPEYQMGKSGIESNTEYSKYLEKMTKVVLAGSSAYKMFSSDPTEVAEGEDRLKAIISNLLVGKFTRFFSFRSDYSKYLEYVNTLCHLFTTYLGISEETVPGTSIKYNEYTDDIYVIEQDKGLGLSQYLGSNRGLHIYYQPDSQLGQSFSNNTQESALANKLNDVSSSSKEAAFFMGAVGANGRNGSIVGAETETGLLYGLATNTWGSTGMQIPMLSRIFSRTGEGVATIIGGNNLQLPEIYSNSSTGSSTFSLRIKLANPYGTPEGAFLFQLRQLARLLAVSLPRQYGPNGYTAPFIVRAFSKGQFNIQLGIVTNLTINRAGDGGSNQTVHDIPMELDVTMEIKDLYREICISNEYAGGVSNIAGNKGLSLLFNNVGLLDFIASYAGYNLNAPLDESKWDYIVNAKQNLIKDVVGPDWKNIGAWKFPKAKRNIYDAYLNATSDWSAWLSN